MTMIAYRITSLTIVYSTFYSGADQSKHQSSASLAFVWGIHRGPGNSPHKGPVTRKMCSFDDVIMYPVNKATFGTDNSSPPVRCSGMYYLNPFWQRFCWTIRNMFQLNVNQSTTIQTVYSGNEFENVICQIEVTLMISGRGWSWIYWNWTTTRRNYWL